MEKARIKEKISCELAFFTARLVELCIERDILWSIENPHTSMLWELLPIQFISQRPDTYTICFPMCAFGTPYKKMTRILTNMVELCSLNRACGYVRHQEILAGKVKVGKSKHGVFVNRTELAGAYPAALAEEWALIVSRRLGVCSNEEKCVAARREFLDRLNNNTQNKAAPAFRCSTEINRAVPRFNSSIIFGQDSAAVRHQKKARQLKLRQRFAEAWANTSSRSQLGLDNPSASAQAP